MVRVDHEDHLGRVRRLLWVLLVFASAASLAGNVTHALAQHSGVASIGPIIAAALAPVALIGLTHLLGLWSHIRSRGVVFWFFLAAIVALSAAAFRLSFDALRKLTITYGYSHADAALFPLILDGLVAVCTLGLVVLTRIAADAAVTQGDAHLRHGDASRVTQPRAPASPAANPPDAALLRGLARLRQLVTRGDAAAMHVEAPVRQTVTQPPHPAVTHADTLTHNGASAVVPHRRVEAPVTQPAHTGAKDAARPITGAVRGRREDTQHRFDGASNGTDTPTAPGTSDHDDQPRMLAHRLVDSGRTTADLTTVHAILRQAQAGTRSRAIAESVGISASSVQRIVKAAREEASSGAA